MKVLLGMMRSVVVTMMQTANEGNYFHICYYTIHDKLPILLIIILNMIFAYRCSISEKENQICEIRLIL